MKTKILVIHHSGSDEGSHQEKIDNALKPYSGWNVRSVATHSCAQSGLSYEANWEVHWYKPEVYFVTTIVLDESVA
jgi:hypothetical protein